MNYVDLSFIFCGYYNIYRQFYYVKSDFTSQLIMIICLVSALMKIFFFLRLFNTCTYIVNMIIRVVFDLRVFFTFYLSFIFIGSLSFDLIGISDSFKYSKIGPFGGSFMMLLQITVGKFEFEVLTADPDQPDWKHYLFWVIWYSYLLFGNVIILNFIIAEVGNSYATVKESI
jgi:hypothetical protein